MQFDATEGGQREAFALPFGCTEGYASTNGTRLHFVEAGTGPLVVLLHGFPEFWYSWRHQLSALASRYHVVAPDLRGYNLSEKPATGYDVTTLCDDVCGLIEALGERQAMIVGHDWGGAIAWALTIYAPEYVSRLAIVNAPHPGPAIREARRPSQLWRSAYIGFFQLRGIAERAIERDEYALIRRAFRRADRAHAWLSDADIQHYVEAIAHPAALSAALAYYRQMFRHDSFRAISPLRVITAPTLVLWGERDPYLGPKLLDGLDLWVRDLTVRRFPTAGHWLNQEASESVNAALLDFLS